MLPRIMLLLPLLGGCAAGPAPPDGLTRFEAAELARSEQRLARSPARVVDGALEDYLYALLCRLEPAGCAALRVYVIDAPTPQADLLGNGVLRLRLGLLRHVHDEAELAFVLAHELAHLQRGHFARRKTPVWSEEVAELEADVDAQAALQRLGFRDDAGTTLLLRLRDHARRSGQSTVADEADLRLAQLPAAGGRLPEPEAALLEVLRHYRP